MFIFEVSLGNMSFFLREAFCADVNTLLINIAKSGHHAFELDFSESASSVFNLKRSLGPQIFFARMGYRPKGFAAICRVLVEAFQGKTVREILLDMVNMREDHSALKVMTVTTLTLIQIFVF